MKLIGTKDRYKFYYNVKDDLPYSVYIDDKKHKAFQRREDMAKYYRERLSL